MMANFHYRLLVVDDEPPIREVLQSLLSTEGYEVGVAEDGLAALAQMRGALPDLILTDLTMPNMSGSEFLSIVRRRFPRIPTIVISSEFQPALGVPADAFLAKPFRFEELLGKVAELLQEAPHTLPLRGTNPQPGSSATANTTPPYPRTGEQGGEKNAKT